MRLTLLRHATVRLEVAGVRLLVDPMLDPAGARPPIQGTPNERRNPLVELPLPAEDAVRDLDAAIVTHLHADHLDETAIRLLPRPLPVLCQPPDVERLAAHGLGPLLPVEHELQHGPIHVTRTGGQHGTGELARRLAPVSGFVLRTGDETVYLAGDTVWCDELEQALEQHRPTVVILNAGGARFLEGDPITMTADDVLRVVEAAPGAALVGVHLEAINHCLETRAVLRARLAGAGASVRVPADGETVTL